MVLGWGKKTVTKHDEDEDMTMDEILASIRRYVTEDQSVPRDTYPGKQPPFVPDDSVRLDSRQPLNPNYDPTPPQSRMTNYDTPYTTNEMLREQSVMSEAPLATPSVEPYLGAAHENNFPQPAPSVPEYAFVPPHPISHSHPQAQEAAVEARGMSAESTISAAAMALSRLSEIKDEQNAAGGIGALTLDTLIVNLARPMIKDWLDEHLSEIVETMVEKEIERIRNYTK